MSPDPLQPPVGMASVPQDDPKKEKIGFRAGEVILSGSQSSLLPVVHGDELVCTVSGLGSCRARFHGKAAA